MSLDAERVMRVLEDNGFYNVRHVNGIIEGFFRPQWRGRDAAHDRIARVLDRMAFMPGVIASHEFPPRHDGVIRVTVMVGCDRDRLIKSVPEEIRDVVSAFV